VKTLTGVSSFSSSSLTIRLLRFLVCEGVGVGVEVGAGVGSIS